VITCDRGRTRPVGANGSGLGVTVTQVWRGSRLCIGRYQAFVRPSVDDGSGLVGVYHFDLGVEVLSVRR